MKLYEQGKFDIDKKLSDYLNYLDTTDKKDIVIKDVLTHQARLKPWIPFYLKTINEDSIRARIYRNSYSDKYSVQVANNLYIDCEYRDSIYTMIINSELRDKKEYKYSDLGYYLIYQIIENITKEPFNKYVENNFYKPLGATTMGYLPLQRFNKKRIVPTENDRKFRKQLLQGYVHDPGTAMLGGVCGHAGVFSNANDLAKMLQMFLQKGEYGGKRYFKPETIELFTSCPFCDKGNRRGIGFDKPEMNYSKPGPTCQCVSEKSFGHTGFTGAIAWADPEEQIVYIFLSNRIHPVQKNKKFIELNVRSKIQEVIY